MKRFTEVWILAYWEEEQSTSAHRASDVVDYSALEVGALCTVAFGQKNYVGKIAATGRMCNFMFLFQSVTTH